MSDFEDSVNIVRTLSSNFEKSATKESIPDDKSKKYSEYVKALNKVLAALEPANPLDIEGLPPHIIEELSSPHGDPLDNFIMVILKACGGEADLDRIIVELWQRFEESTKRRFLQNKMWRMSKKELVWSVPGRKGVYTTTKPTTDTNEPDVSDHPSELENKPEATNNFENDGDLEDEIPF